jgi:PTH1 family peptidyl-tRNA hydrolase
LRVGIGKNFHPGEQVNYVLGKWSSEELKTLPAILDSATDAIKSFAAIGLKRAMEQVNSSGSKAAEKN